MSEIIFAAKNLEKQYWKFRTLKKHHALDGFDMEIRRGDIYGFVGENGAGKTTLMRILTEPKSALVKQYQKLFGFDDVRLTFEKDAVKAIAKQAFDRKTGARGLRSIIEKVLMDVMFRIPSDDTIEECIITKGVVEGESEPLLIHREVLKRAR